MSRKHSTALGIGAAMGGAAVAAFLSMGMAHADDLVVTPPVDDGFQILFGAPGTLGRRPGRAPLTWCPTPI